MNSKDRAKLYTLLYLEYYDNDPHRLAMLEWMEYKIRQLDPDWCSNNEKLHETERMLVELMRKYKKPFIEQGFSLGEIVGMKCIVKEILIGKFGTLYPTWEGAVSKINDPDILCRFSRAIACANSPTEVNALLNELD